MISHISVRCVLCNYVVGYSWIPLLDSDNKYVQRSHILLLLFGMYICRFTYDCHQLPVSNTLPPGYLTNPLSTVRTLYTYVVDPHVHYVNCSILFLYIHLYISRLMKRMHIIIKVHMTI